MNAKKYGNTGFTLIELLVVIAIIAILAAILFPVFATAREKARQAADASNLKQIGLAFLQYQQDYDEFYPLSVTERYAPQGDYQNGTSNAGGSPNFVDNAAEAAAYSIRAILSPYVKSNGVWHDPSQISSWSWDGPTTFSASETYSTDSLQTTGSTGRQAWFLTDYGFNFDEGVWGDAGLYAGGTATNVDGYGIALNAGPTYSVTQPAPTSGYAVAHAGDFFPGGPFRGDGFNGTINLAKVTSQATFILGGDSVRNKNNTATGYSVSRGSLTPQPAVNNSDGSLYLFGNQSASNYDGSQAAIHLRHSGGANFVFGDGHVKWLKPEQTWNPSASPVINYWARSQ